MCSEMSATKAGQLPKKTAGVQPAPQQLTPMSGHFVARALASPQNFKVKIRKKASERLIDWTALQSAPVSYSSLATRGHMTMTSDSQAILAALKPVLKRQASHPFPHVPNPP